MPKILPTLLIYIIVVVSSLFLFSFPSIANAQIVINEFSSGTTSDWVEIYNIATESADLSLYKLEDKTGNTRNLSGILISGGFLSFDWSNRLDNAGDIFKLVKISSSEVLDTISYGDEGGVCAPGATESAGRVDNGNTIERFTTPTKDATNIGAQLFPCPTPTPEPTPTPIATSTPTPTPTPTPTKTTTPKPSPKEEIVSESETSSNDQVLGLREQLKTSEPEGEDNEDSKQKFPVFPVILIIVGAGLMGFAGYTLFKKMKSEGYNSESEENN